MPDEEKFIKLNDFENETFFRLKFQIAGGMFHGFLKFKFSLSWNIKRRKQVRDQTQENWNKIFMF